MNSLVSSLWHEVSSRFQRLPVWLPGTPMDLGDVGVFEESGWVKHTTLDALGIAFSADTDGQPVSYDYSSQDGAEVNMRLSVAGVPALAAVVAGNMGMHIRFARPGAFVLKARSVTVRRIAELAAVDRQILDRYREKRWESGWVLVSEVARGGPSITIVSGSNRGEAVVDLGAGVGGGAGPLIGAGFGVASGNGLAASFISPTEATLLWRGRRVYDRWLRQPRVVDRGEGLREDEVLDYEVRAGRGAGTGREQPPEVIEIEYPQDLPALAEHG